MEVERMIREWLASEGAIDPVLRWASTDVVDMVDSSELDRLFQLSVELFRALVTQLVEIGSEHFVILVVPLEYSDELDVEAPKREELASIGARVETPSLYRTEVLVDSWQPVEQFRMPVSYDLEFDRPVECFYTCWRSARAQLAGEEYSRDLHLLWRP